MYSPRPRSCRSPTGSRGTRRCLSSNFCLFHHIGRLSLTVFEGGVTLSSRPSSRRCLGLPRRRSDRDSPGFMVKTARSISARAPRE